MKKKRAFVVVAEEPPVSVTIQGGFYLYDCSIELAPGCHVVFETPLGFLDRRDPTEAEMLAWLRNGRPWQETGGEDEDESL